MMGSRVAPLRRVLLFTAVLFAVLFAASARARTAQSPPQLAVELDLPAYKAELDRCAQSIHQPKATSQLLKSLPQMWVVRTGEARVEVPTEWLVSRLERLEREPANSASVSQEIELHLAAMRKAALDLESASNGPPPEEARAHLEKILQRREFGGLQGPSQLEVLKARIARWIDEQIYKLLSRLHLGKTAGNVLAWGIVALAFVALCYWVWSNLSRGVRARETPAESPAEPSDSRMWARDALAAAERGDYREAVHCAYWAAVVHLEALGVLRRDRARTPRESLRLLDPHPHEQKLLGEFTRHFELIWYGYRPASLEDWSDARAQLEKMGCLTASTPATANS